MKNVPEKRIFISYRVQDTAGETGRLVDALKQHFTDDQLFMDIENLEPGVDFSEAIERSLGGCDVLLAIIGPRWIGPREGQPPRIQDANDWVRQEVATALQRNIRVVPVLADGASLPKEEDLPPDLHPLLKRQTLEISNKRWRYDTDQLALFLVNSVGIQPRRAWQRKAQTEPKKNRTWLYVAGGFVLALALIIGLATAIDNEKKAEPQQVSGGEGTTTPLNVVPANNEEPQAANISGTWQEVDEGITTTFELIQSGSQVTVAARIAAEQIGNGTGTVNGNSVYLEVPLFGVAATLSGTLSDDGQMITGTYNIPATGESKGFKLVKK